MEIDLPNFRNVQDPAVGLPGETPVITWLVLGLSFYATPRKYKIQIENRKNRNGSVYKSFLFFLFFFLISWRGISVFRA